MLVDQRRNDEAGSTLEDLRRAMAQTKRLRGVISRELDHVRAERRRVAELLSHPEKREHVAHEG